MQHNLHFFYIKKFTSNVPRYLEKYIFYLNFILYIFLKACFVCFHKTYALCAPRPRNGPARPHRGAPRAAFQGAAHHPPPHGTAPHLLLHHPTIPGMHLHFFSLLYFFLAFSFIHTFCNRNSLASLVHFFKCIPTEPGMHLHFFYFFDLFFFTFLFNDFFFS